MAGAHLRVGEVAEEVVGLAEELDVDLIVVGTRGRGVIGRALMGSVSDSVVRHAHCPVVVARSQETSDSPGGFVMGNLGGSETMGFDLWSVLVRGR